MKQDVHQCSMTPFSLYYRTTTTDTVPQVQRRHGQTCFPIHIHAQNNHKRRKKNCATRWPAAASSMTPLHIHNLAHKNSTQKKPDKETRCTFKWTPTRAPAKAKPRINNNQKVRTYLPKGCTGREPSKIEVRNKCPQRLHNMLVRMEERKE